MFYNYWLIIYGLLLFYTNALANVVSVVSLEEVIETETSKYFLNKEATNQEKAREICDSNDGHLISIDSQEEDHKISEILKGSGIDVIWTDGIRFANSTVDDFYMWSSSLTPMTYSNFHEEVRGKGQQRSSAALQLLRRNHRNKLGHRIGKRQAEKCNCDCATTTTPTPFNPPPACKFPVCNVIIPNPPCQQVEPPTCDLTRPPVCSASERNCTVDCGAQCRVVKQPECKIKPSSKPRCRLEQNPGNCETKPPKCSIVKPAVCHSIQDPCTQDKNSTCQAITKPCKNACTDRPCYTTQAPCVTTQPPCATSTTCPPIPPECVKKCIQDSARTCPPGKKCEPVRICEIICPDTTAATVKTCEETTDCPPAETTCPPPVTECKRPFVDCSPEYCQSSVHVCLPPKISCPPPRIVCGQPEIKCEDPETTCPDEPEVICEEEEVECTKPVIECPSAVVHCNPILTTCGHAGVSCTDPIMSCKQPEVICDKPVTCPVFPILPPPGSSCPCNGKCGDAEGKNTKGRLELPPDAEYVDTLQCIAVRKDLGFKWTMQSCDVKHPFICEITKGAR